MRAWAWVASRFLDYLGTDKTVDAKQVGIAGHSRRKAFPGRPGLRSLLSVGCSSKFIRRRRRQALPPHLRRADAQHCFRFALSLDGRQLPALRRLQNSRRPARRQPRAHRPHRPAPCLHRLRALPTGTATPIPMAMVGADLHGMFLAEVAAGPVYKLLGKKDLGTSSFPPIETAVVSGDLAFRQHNDGHTPAPNWPAFLDFASRYLHAPQAQQ